MGRYESYRVIRTETCGKCNGDGRIFETDWLGTVQYSCPDCKGDGKTTLVECNGNYQWAYRDNPDNEEVRCDECGDERHDRSYVGQYCKQRWYL